MKTILPLLAASGIAFSLGSCSTPPPPPPPPVDMVALTAEIQAMEDAYAAANVAKDVDAIMPYYSEDVISYSQYKEPTKGKAAMRQRLAESMAKDTTDITPTYTVLELFAGEEHMTEIGSWVDTDASGNEVDHGTYFSIFRKSGDGWECIRDIAVSAVPKKDMNSEADTP